ncbi:unnamed protein product [Effrenium voratum]|nr:unnamed protein product [Effrenium voratum]
MARRCPQAARQVEMFARVAKHQTLASSLPAKVTKAKAHVASRRLGQWETVPTEAGPPRPPLPEDIGYQAGFQAAGTPKSVAENRVADAVALAMSPFWPFTNELDLPAFWQRQDQTGVRGVPAAPSTCRCSALTRPLTAGRFSIWPPTKAMRSFARRCVSGKTFLAWTCRTRSFAPLHFTSQQGSGALLAAVPLWKAADASRSYAAIAAHPDCNPLLPDKHGRSAVEYAADRGLEVDCQVPGHSEIEM